MAGGNPLPVQRDAWACLVRWHDAGEPIHRLTSDDVERARSGLPLDTPLATAPIRAKGMLYIVDRDEWMLVARHEALEPYQSAPDCPPRAYTEPMLTYATMFGDGLASGTINLRDAPTPAALRIYPGTSHGKLGAITLDREQIAPEMIRLAKCLPHFYR